MLQFAYLQLVKFFFLLKMHIIVLRIPPRIEDADERGQGPRG